VVEDFSISSHQPDDITMLYLVCPNEKEEGQ